jgi:hypothetical protein
MCIRITRELKMVYEQQIEIGLSIKIGFPVFVKILTLMGYLNARPVEATRLEDSND